MQEAGTVTNIVGARIPGTDSSSAIALNAHYDSGPAGPGASDCGSCVAAVLESARAVRAGGPLQNDVLLIFSDAEENGDLGAAAFAEQSPLMRDIDVVLNWETAGGHGASTSSARIAHGWSGRCWRRADARPLGAALVIPRALQGAAAERRRAGVHGPRRGRGPFV